MAFDGLFLLPETFGFALFYYKKNNNTDLSKKLAHHNY